MVLASSQTVFLSVVMKSLEVWAAYGDTVFLLREKNKIKITSP
jgi:hypothetical protein